MDLGLPADLTWYKLLTDWGGFVGAAIALLAAAVTFLVVNGQTREAATEEAQRRKSARRAEALDVVRAITLVEGALDVFDNDLSHVSNTFDPRSQDEGFLATKIDPERAAWIRSRLTPPIFESLLPYVGRVDPRLAKWC